jgi:hypothetical protein
MVGGREGRLIRIFHQRVKLVHASIVYINTNGSLKNNGRLQNCCIQCFHSNKMKRDQFFTQNMSMKLDLSHTFNSSSRVMNLLQGGRANLLMHKSKRSLYNILR